ncbi:749_t:CDS:2 [Diversispora eburnea]|uniref:749_t:CDS:1 n=1 Tax=Diversispora eburnea TaxID=1213867 RepID=A0A9N9FU87_9GLOM|nr:749_t:CDS:2 [Diversispora eburnea]
MTLFTRVIKLLTTTSKNIIIINSNSVIITKSKLTTKLSKLPLNNIKYGYYFNRGLTTNLNNYMIYDNDNINKVENNNINNKFDKIDNNKIGEIDKNKIKEANKICKEKKEFYDKNYTIGFINYELLEDFPAWLKGLGLKALIPCFEGINWKDIIEMNSTDLSELGIKNKNIKFTLLNHFWMIKQDMVTSEGIRVPRIELDSIEEEENDDDIEKFEYDQDDPKPFAVDPRALQDVEYLLSTLGLQFVFIESLFQGKTPLEIFEMTKKDLENIGITSGYMRRRCLATFKKYRNIVKVLGPEMFF